MVNSKAKRPEVVISNPDIEKGKQKLNLLRLVLTSEYTRVDFGYQTTGYYARGGWVNISGKTFIRTRQDKKEYRLKEVKGICIAPEKFHFKSIQDSLYFSLYFGPIPQDTETIDLIEKEPDNGHNFNFYGVSLNTKGSREEILK